MGGLFGRGDALACMALAHNKRGGAARTSGHGIGVVRLPEIQRQPAPYDFALPLTGQDHPAKSKAVSQLFRLEGVAGCGITALALR